MSTQVGARESEVVDNQPVDAERARMNIPNASHHTTALAETRAHEIAEHDNHVYQVQVEALETALNEPVGENGVTLDLDNPLHDDIARQLSENGYSYTTSSVSSTVNGETRSRNTVTVYPETPVGILDQFNLQADVHQQGQSQYQSLFRDEFIRYLLRRPRWF